MVVKIPVSARLRVRPVRRMLVPLSWALFVLGAFAVGSAWAQPTIWTGMDITFTRSSAGGPELPQNQDRITEYVWLTRDELLGIFNRAPDGEGFIETAYNQSELSSPAGTAWATLINNPDLEDDPDDPNDYLSPANYESLIFSPWREAYNGGQGRLPDNLVANLAVVKLIGDEANADDDIYFNLQFLEGWGVGGGGAFTYLRGSAPRTGDYNNDGSVNSADYVVWRNTLGEAVTMRGGAADGDASGFVDIGDFLFWKQNYGNPGNQGAGTAARTIVPEPSTLGLLVAGASLLAFRPATRLPRSVRAVGI